MSIIAIDFETFFSSKLKYSVKTMIPEQYCSHDLFDAYLVSVSDGTNAWSGHPSNLNWAALEGQTLLSHNARFDRAVYAELVKRGLAPRISVPAWHCTANMTSFLCNRRALKPAVHYLLGVNVDKEAREESDNRHWSDFSKAEQIRMAEYARLDSVYCWTLFDKFGAQWPEVERRLSDQTIRQGMRGVQINLELLDQYIYQSHEMRTNTERLIPWIAGAEDDADSFVGWWGNPGGGWEGFNTKPTSIKCLAEQCRRTGIPCPPVKSDDEEAYLAWETHYSKNNPWVSAVRAWRSINKSYRTFCVIKERIRDDGTLPFSLKYFGAHTGRWSGDARVNMQNMRKRPLVCNDRGLLETSDNRVDAALEEKQDTGKLPGWVRYVIDFRSLIIPRPGKKMIISDLSQIEPRVLAYLSGDSDFLQLVAGGESPYVAHARASMGFTGAQMDKRSDLYKLAKARILALGYQCGWEKFITMAQDLAGIDITVDDPEEVEECHPITGEIRKVSGYGYNSKRIVKEFRAQSKKTVGMWKELSESFSRSVGGTFSITLPSGRIMKYDNVRCSIRCDQNPETKQPRHTSVFTANTDGRQKPFYGGKLTENLVQAVSRDVFANQLVSMENRGWDVLFSVHDEAVLEVDPSVGAAEVEREMSKCPEWLAGCPISAKAEEVTHYQK